MSKNTEAGPSSGSVSRELPGCHEHTSLQPRGDSLWSPFNQPKGISVATTFFVVWPKGISLCSSTGGRGSRRHSDNVTRKEKNTWLPPHLIQEEGCKEAKLLRTWGPLILFSAFYRGNPGILNIGHLNRALLFLAPVKATLLCKRIAICIQVVFCLQWRHGSSSQSVLSLLAISFLVLPQ